VFADEIGMVGFPGQRFRRRAGGGVSVGGADGTSGRRQESRWAGHGQVSSYTPISSGFSFRKSKMAPAQFINEVKRNPSAENLDLRY
jgi:hypothetical protein